MVSDLRFSYLEGEENRLYTHLPIILVVGSVVSLDLVNGLILATFATMAIPTMISAIYLSPKVKAASKSIFKI